MRRRTLILLASAILLISIAVGMTFLVFGDSAELTVSDDPFGGIGSGLVDGEPLPEADAGAGTEYAPRLVRITDKPVAEGVVAITRTSTTTALVVPEEPAVSLDTATGTATSSIPAPAPVAVPTETVVIETEVRFIDRASGNIYRYRAQERSLTRLSNKTLPGIQRASWLTDGSRAYVQFLTGGEEAEYVATYVLPDNGEGGFFLEQNLASAEAVGSGSLFTLLAGTTGSIGSLSSADGTGARTLFTSLLSAIIVHPTQGNYFAHTRASAYLDGYGFQVAVGNGSFTRILGPLRGLSMLPSPAGDKVLYSYADQGVMRLAVFDVATRVTTALPVATLTEKCVWTADSTALYCGVPVTMGRNLPDDWYQGVARFTDRLWRIDITDRLATLVVDPSEVAELSLDAVALAVDPAQDALFFTDRHTGSLWVYDL
jgi:hypothetical protein